MDEPEGEFRQSRDDRVAASPQGAEWFPQPDPPFTKPSRPMPPPPLPDKKRGTTRFFAGLGVLVSGLYLLNPTFGLFELIPDNTPFIGNLDEAGATLLLLTCLAQFGLSLPGLRGRKPPSHGKDDDVIDV